VNNIDKRHKQGKRPHRPGEKGYPKTLKIENTMKLTSEQLRLIIAEEVANISQTNTRWMGGSTGGGTGDSGSTGGGTKKVVDCADATDYERFLDREYNEDPTDADIADAKEECAEKNPPPIIGRHDGRLRTWAEGRRPARRRGKRIAEGHARITEDEVAAWKSGDWGYNAQQDSSHDHDRFLHGSESGHPMDDEGYMIKSRMSSMKTMASDVCDLLDSEDQLPSWVQDLVASSHSDMQHVHDYLMGVENESGYSGAHAQNANDVAGESRRHNLQRIAEGHARITQEEFAAWKNGDWGFVSENSESSSPCAYCGKDIKAKDRKSHEQKCSSAY